MPAAIVPVEKRLYDISDGSHPCIDFVSASRLEDSAAVRRDDLESESAILQLRHFDSSESHIDRRLNELETVVVVFAKLATSEYHPVLMPVLHTVCITLMRDRSAIRPQEAFFLAQMRSFGIIGWLSWRS